MFVFLGRRILDGKPWVQNEECPRPFWLVLFMTGVGVNVSFFYLRATNTREQPRDLFDRQTWMEISRVPSAAISLLASTAAVVLP